MSAKVLTTDEASRLLAVELIANGRGSQAVHETVVAYRANRRAGTHATLTKAMVAASGKKPWRQKGTGRARAGDTVAPHWVGGGVAFGPQPRDYSKKTPRKVKRLAFRKAIGERVKAGDFLVVDGCTIAEPKTKAFMSWLTSQGVEKGKSALVVAETRHDEGFLRASRNVPKVATTTAALLNVEEVLRYDKILLTEAALEQIGKRMAAA